jgi:hypothetical protein
MEARVTLLLFLLGIARPGLGYLKNDADGEAVIREVSALLYDTFSRLAHSSDLGRVISER